MPAPDPGPAGAAAEGRVLVVSAAMGAGHHAAADELVRRLRARGGSAERVDLLQLGRPGQGRRLVRIYQLLLRWVPWGYDLVMRSWARWPAPWERLTASGASAYERGLLAEIERFRPDLIVSVYNLASQALGRLRSSGRLAVPVVTYVIDPGAHPYWISPGVDRHLGVLPGTVEALHRFGARAPVRVAPLLPTLPVPDEPERRARRRAARERLGLPADGAIALVSGGSWAAGGLPGTFRLLAGSPAVLPVAVCGRDARLRQRLQREVPRAIDGLTLGWTGDLVSWLDAADVLVDNGGGTTCWEALSRAVPVVLFRPLPGHGRFNARALDQAGLVSLPRTDRALVPAVRALCGDSELAAAQRARARVALSGPAVELVLCGTEPRGVAQRE